MTFSKPIDKLKEDGWLSEDNINFFHPLCHSDFDVRKRLNDIDLLTTNKCRITIITQPRTEIQIA